VAVILGVVKLFTPVPLANTVPNVAAAYQSTVIPLGVVALMITDPVPHLEPAVPAVGTAGTAFTVANTGVRVAETQVVPILDSA